ncbi:MAG: FHA domain-containing protein [Candidatus Pseudobacter hemicellulosilyticus]|uniref:FHA domain-containing protein n=1 Tax=Candidatus Pseudobacter hemicellulosilyticus TaxID=3121375 RepID=A0AAJ5WQ29_9BACT|nr:MAG: FHA domain-containing protein [Pseudobacter sp.]
MKKLFAKASMPDNSLPATLLKREAITAFILHALQPYVDEKSLSLAALHLYVHCENHEQEEAAGVALCVDRPGLFRTEHLERKLQNHFIQLEPDWVFSWSLINGPLPEHCIQEGALGLTVRRAGERNTARQSTARLEVLSGQAACSSYLLDPQVQQKYFIGRTNQPQLASGRIRRNDIAFLDSDETGYDENAGRANAHVSRDHAYIIYDPAQDQYFLYPDKGGLPENGNKTRVHTADDKVKHLTIQGVAHALQHEDQIELGGAAVLLFTRQ